MTTETPTTTPAEELPVDDPAQAPTERLITRIKSSVHTAVATWWGFIAQPPSIAEVRRRSAMIDPRRVPADSKLLIWLWYWSNRTDRRLLLAFIVTVAPLWAVGPLLYCAERPTRRWTLYGVVFLLTVIVPSVVGG